ncbi:MAG: hypothetical protein ACKO23_10585 [Gemmataceae bacterium]
MKGGILPEASSSDAAANAADSCQLVVFDHLGRLEEKGMMAKKAMRVLGLGKTLLSRWLKAC